MNQQHTTLISRMRRSNLRYYFRLFHHFNSYAMENCGAKILFSIIKRKISSFSSKSRRHLLKSLIISMISLFFIYTFLSSHPRCQSFKPLNTKFGLVSKWRRPHFRANDAATSIDHLVFGIAGSSATWGNRRLYVDSWWQPNMTRGFLFLDRPPVEHLPWSPTSPPYRLYEDDSQYKEYNKHGMPFAIRMARVVEEMFKVKSEYGARWFVMTHDDTVVFIDNLVEVLSRYDHRKYFYIGMNSESISINNFNSFEMAFGGAGFALSYPLAKEVAKNMDLCIRRYPTLYGSDHILQSCIADLGVSLTQEKGFHQIDLRSDILGFLLAHPQSPLLSLHHLDVVDPIFPSMNHVESLNHLMKASKFDQSRLLQQSICCYKPKNWTFSVSWGYSVQIYPKIYPPSVLYRPLETFFWWTKGAIPPHMFNTRVPSRDPCEAPRFLFFASVDENKRNNHIVTTYTATSHPPCRWPCVSNTTHSTDEISKIHVLSPLERHGGYGSRRECCDVVQLVGMDSIAIKLRDCMKDEIVA